MASTKRNIQSIGACTTTILLALIFTGCQRTADEPFAKVVPSAVIEIRDEPTQAELDKETQVVVLGTGNPIPDAYRAGPSIAVIHKGEAYLFDVGAVRSSHRRRCRCSRQIRVRFSRQKV